MLQIAQNKVSGKIISADEITDSEFAVDLSPDDLMTGMFAEEFSEDEDLAEYNEMIKTLTEQGYEDLEDIDFETLAVLNKRNKKVQSPEKYAEVIARGFLLSLQDAQKLLVNSQATLGEPSTSSSAALQLMNNVARDDNSKELFTFVNGLISELLSDGQNIDCDLIFKIIRENPKYSQRLSNWTASDLYAELMTIVPAILQYNEKERDNQNRLGARKIQTANHILKALKDKATELVDVAERKELSFVKQVFKTKDGYCIKCNKCGKRLLLNHGVSMTLKVVTERNADYGNYSDKISDIQQFPLPYTCECGHAMVFLEKDYKEIQKAFVSNCSSGIREASQIIQQISKGTAYLKVITAIEYIEQAIPEIVFAESELSEVHKTDEITVSWDGVDDLEFKEAVKKFYEKLKFLNCKSVGGIEVKSFAKDHTKSTAAESDTESSEPVTISSETMSYAEIARYYANILSIDYDTLHNKAVFSIIFNLTEFPILKQKMDYSEIWSLENLLAYIREEDFKSTSYIDSDCRSLLYEVITKYLKMECDWNNTEVLLEIIRNNVMTLEELLNKKRSEYEELIARLEDRKDALGYCNFVNLPSCKLSSLDCYVPNRRVRKLFDEVADRMIINNFSGEFYEHWEQLRKLNQNTLRKQLKKTAMAVTAQESIENALGKYTDAWGMPRFSSAMRYFSKPIVSEHEQLRKAANAARNNNFYRFCKFLNEVPLNTKSYVSDEFDNHLFDALMRIQKFSKKLNGISEVQFYLTELSPEELAAVEHDVRHLEFHDKIPHRKSGESAAEYATRLNRLDRLDQDPDCKDLSKFFNGVFDNVLDIILAANLSSITYESFATATFMSKLVSELIERYSKESSRKMLGISQEVLNLIDHQIENTSDNTNYDVIADFNRLLLGIYPYEFYKLVDKMEKQYEMLSLHAEDSLNKRTDIFDYVDNVAATMEELEAICNLPDSTADAEEIARYAELYIKSDSMKGVIVV